MNEVNDIDTSVFNAGYRANVIGFKDNPYVGYNLELEKIWNRGWETSEQHQKEFLKKVLKKELTATPL